MPTWLLKRRSGWTNFLAKLIKSASQSSAIFSKVQQNFQKKVFFMLTSFWQKIVKPEKNIFFLFCTRVAVLAFDTKGFKKQRDRLFLNLGSIRLLDFLNSTTGQFCKTDTMAAIIAEQFYLLWKFEFLLVGQCFIR